MKNHTFCSLITLIISIFMLTESIHSQISNQNDSITFKNNDIIPEVNPWGRIKLMIIQTNGNIGVTDAGSRFGLVAKQKISNNISIFSGIEISIFLTSNGDFRLSPDNSSNTGFLNLVSVASGNLFGLRKGFIGADFEKYGRVSIGKQYGAYYEVAGITDISENNSGYASYVFSPEGTDGGFTGTGRASNSILYKNSISNLNIAVSGQFKLSEKEFSRLINSLGGSVLYSFPYNLSAGIAFNEVFLTPNFESRIRGLNSNPVYSSIGVNYSTDKLFFGINYAYQQNGDIEQIKDSTVVYSGYGIEIAAKWNPFKYWSILGGVNYKHPHNVDPLVNKAFNRLIYFYGLQYQPFDHLLFYLEGALDKSVTSKGESIPDNISTGIKFNF